MANPSFLTLLLAIAIAQVFLCSAPSANALQGMNLAPPIVRRAEHAEIKERMLRKRRPANNPADVPVNPAGNVPTATDPTTATTSTSTETPPSTRATTSAIQSSSTPPSISNVLSSLVTPPSSTTSKSTSIASTPSPTTQTSASQTAVPIVIGTLPSISSAPHTTNASGGTVFVTASATDAAQASDVSQDPSASFLPKSVIIGLIVTGSCIAAGAAIWTIIRKWKFSPSRHFEDRLEPINWEPTQDSGLGHDPTVAALARAGSKTGTRPSSYMSEDHDGNMSSVHPEPISVAPDFPPAHDFTAGAATTGGYVDMHRGPSPAPGQYGSAYGGQYETPNPYDAYDYNGYGQRRY